MSDFDIAALDDLYERVSSDEGIGVVELQAELRRLFGLPRSDEDLQNYRLGRMPWKRLADEISPVSRFLLWRNYTAGRVRFPLNNEPPDCWLFPDDGSDPEGIEVTIAQARERFHLAKELINKLWGRGFIGVSDDAPQEDFDLAMSRQRTMHSTNHVVSAVSDGILRCISRKNKPAFAGLTILIQAPLSSLPTNRRKLVRDRVSAAALGDVPFGKLFVISNADEPPYGFQIK
jgi:hypothetical protein